MTDMTSYERILRTFEHRETDRVPINELAWGTTLTRWHAEGMPKDVAYEDYFGIDRAVYIKTDNSPRYPFRTLEETDEYTLISDEWGATQKRWRHIPIIPEWTDFRIKDRVAWQEAKERLAPSKDRIPWAELKKEYPRWRRAGYWIQGRLWWGFDVTHTHIVGTERLLMALVDDPEWIVNIFETTLDLDLALLDMVWDAGYTFDCIRWPDDMGYKHAQFFSVDLYREILKPLHKRAVDWAHAKGIKAHLHSDGDVNPFIPEFIDIGLDALNPMEVKAGMDPIAIKKRYGDDLMLQGGINGALYDDYYELEAELHRVVPTMMNGGGYVYACDHSVPETIGLEDYKRIIALAKKLGTY
jgi:uroporphyrinogen decarboxylase